MFYFIRVVLLYPLILLLYKLTKKLPLFILAIILASGIFFYSNQIQEKLPGTLWDLSGEVEEDIPIELTRHVKVIKGDSLEKILKSQNLSTGDVYAIINCLKPTKISRALKIGQLFTFYYETEIIQLEEADLTEERLVLKRLAINLSRNNNIELTRQPDNSFKLHYLTTALKKLLIKHTASIDKNVMLTLKNLGLNTNNIIKLIHAYSYQIDFQRQIKSGDTISLLTEKFVTPKGEFSHHGKILYAALTLSGKKYEIFNYKPTKHAHSEFYLSNGKSIKKSLLRTPVDVVRISSHFGYRKKHPVLGYGKMHKGVDFAASIGTPILAAGKGVVKFIGWKSGYGRFILIQHDKNISTAYAHASKFAKHLKKGSKVQQGDVIAYVGKSGRVTGPHLHYEVRVNGKQVNPIKFKTTTGTQLNQQEMRVFKNYHHALHKLHARLESNQEINAKLAKLPNEI